MKTIHVKISLFLFLICIVSAVRGQVQDPPEPTLESPHNAMYVHLHYLQPESFVPRIAAEPMHPGLDSATAIRRAIKLKQILDGRGLYVHLNKIPKNTDYVDSISNEAIYTPFPQLLPEVYLEKVGNKWYYSAETIDDIPELHKNVYPFGADVLLRIFPKTGDSKFLGLKAWQWLGIGLLLVLSYLLHFLLSQFFRILIRYLSKSRLHFEFITIPHLKQMARYLSLFVIGYLVRAILPALQFNIETSQFVQKGVSIYLIVIATLIVLLVITISSDHGEDLASRTENRMDEQLIPLIRRILKIIVVIIATVWILEILTVNITALIAGVSIGGLALALAAQDTVKNLIGSVMIFIDQPFQMGDYVIGNDFEGTIEEVGFRTTRIRGIDTAVIAVPNGVLSNLAVKNLGVRNMRLFNILIGLTYDSKPEQIQDFIARLKELILTNEHLDHETYYVYFREFGDSAIKIMFRCYIKSDSFPFELEVKETLLLDIMRTASDVGVSFAFPSTSVYIEKGLADKDAEGNMP